MRFSASLETREGDFYITEDDDSKRIAHIHYSLEPEFSSEPEFQINSAFVKVYTNSGVMVGEEPDHDIHYFSNGVYVHSALGFSSSKKVLKSRVKLVLPEIPFGGHRPPVNPLIVVLPNFSLDETVRQFLSERDLPEEHTVKRVIGNYF